MEQPGIERSSLNGKLQIQKQTDNEFRFGWENLYPQNAIERHFLVATDLEKNKLADIVQIEGSLNGDIHVKSTPFQDIRDKIDNVAVIAGFVMFISSFVGAEFLVGGAIVLLSIIFNMLPKNIIGNISLILKIKYVRYVVSGVRFTFVILLVAFATLVVAPGISSYLFGVPSWAEPSFFPPYYTERLLAAISEMRGR